MKNIRSWLKKKIDGKSIRLLFSISFFLTISLFTMLILSLYSKSTKAQITSFLQEKNVQQLRRMSFSMEEEIEDTIELANTAYYQIIKSRELQDLFSEQLLSDFCQLHKNKILYAAIYDLKGTLLWQSTDCRPKESVQNAAWFQRATEQIDIVAFDIPRYVQTETGFQKAMPVSRYVELQDDGKNRSGILRLDVCMDNLEEQWNIYPSSQTDYYYLIDENEQFICDPFEKRRESGIRTEWTLSAPKNQVVVKEQHKWLIQQQTIGYTGWKLIAVASLTAELQNSTELRMGIAVIILFMALISAILDLLIQRLMIAPVSKLSETMKQFGHGNLQVRANVEGCGEIKVLAHGFNDMADKTNQLMERLLKEEKEKQITERKLLQSQINPHFLYNTLDSIIWMIQSKKYEGAGNMVSLLAKFFRISLSQGKDIIPLKKEMEHAVSYLSIQNVRFQDKFTFTVDWDETLADCLCPKLIIQPLLENAIYHGMEGMYEDGEIKIKIYTKDALVYIDVIDNGEGMTEAQVQKMMQGNVVSSKRGSGIGVKNVNDRIKLYFGAAYGVQILSALDEGTTARIYFPIRRQEHETEK